jgi:hypothetical protein
LYSANQWHGIGHQDGMAGAAQREPQQGGRDMNTVSNQTI